MPKPPLFIIGNPRSGTTLLRLMVTSHRAMVVPPECGFAVWWWKKYADWTAGDARLGEFITDLAAAKKMNTWGLDYDGLARKIEAERPSSYSELVSSIYSFYARSVKPTAVRWGDKNNFYLNHIAELHKLYPTALFLHVSRDGRDVACSYRELYRKQIQSEFAPRLPFSPGDIATEWTRNLTTIRESLANLPASQKLEVRYEDIVAHTERELRRICFFIDEEFDPGMLEYHIKNREQELEPREFLQWKALTLEAPNPSQTRRFEKDLSPSEIAEFEAVARPMLDAYGYR